MAYEDREVKIKVGDNEYELLLTTKATREISKRYGGLEKLGDKLTQSKTFEDSIGEIVWLLALLINQPILVYNIKNKGNEKPLVTEDEIELLTTPSDLSDYKEAITEALYRGTKRYVESESDSKNAAGE